MITYSKPEVKSLAPKNLSEIISNGGRDLYVIENTIQRPFVWGSTDIDKFWSDALILFNKNFENRKQSPFDFAYLDFSSLDYSEVDEHNKERVAKTAGIKNKSIIDGSQRTRLALCTYIGFLYYRAKISGQDYIDINMIKSTDGYFKYMDICESKIDKLYSYIEETTVEKFFKDRINRDKCDKIFANSEDEKDLKHVLFYMSHRIEENIIDDLDFENCLTIFLNNIYFYEEHVDSEYKFNRFLDRNNAGTPMSEKDLFPKYIINQFYNGEKDKVHSAYVEFEEMANACETKGNETFVKTKKGKHALLFIMEEVLKIVLGRKGHKKCFKSDLTLKDAEYGIEFCIKNHYWFNTVEESIEYFNECKKMAIFINEDSMKNHDDIVDDCYQFRNFAKKDVVWWYFIKPSYIMNNILPHDKRKFTKDILFRGGYITYIISRSVLGSTNSQNLINTLEKISYTMIQEKDTDYMKYKSIIIKIMENYRDNMNLIQMGLENGIRNVSYIQQNHRQAIEHILISLEYDLITKFSWMNKDGFYSFFKRKKSKTQSNIEHWYPDSLTKNDGDLNDCANKLGNLTLLEPNLNSIKGNDMSQNNLLYSQSIFNITKHMCETYTGNMSREDKSELSKHLHFKRYSEDTINNPRIDIIKEREARIRNFIMSFINEPFEY